MAAKAGSFAVLRILTKQFFRLQGPRVCCLRSCATKNESNGTTEHSFDTKLLDILVCPLSKKPLSKSSTKMMLGLPVIKTAQEFCPPVKLKHPHLLGDPGPYHDCLLQLSEKLNVQMIVGQNVWPQFRFKNSDFSWLMDRLLMRYDPALNELVCDELGVAYPIVNGIPNLVPSDGRILNEQTKHPEEPTNKP